MEEKILTDQQLRDQERDSDPEDPEPPQIKEEQEELCSSQDVEELVLKQETETFMLLPTNEENEQSEPEPNGDHELLCDSSPVAESQRMQGCKHADSGSTRNAEPEPKDKFVENTGDGNSGDKSVSKTHCEAQSAEKSFECGFCGKAFCRESKLNVHIRLHTGETPFVCKTCGKGFRQISALNTHLKIHTGKKPYSCKTCGKGFLRSSNLLVHQRTHTGEKPYSCETCGKGFTHRSNLMVHLRTHTELPLQFVCRELEGKTDQEKSSGLDQEPPQMKEEKEELCSRQEETELVLKQETSVCMLAPTDEESDHQLLSDSSSVAESQDQEGSQHVDSASSRKAEPKAKRRRRSNTSRTSNADNSHTGRRTWR